MVSYTDIKKGQYDLIYRYQPYLTLRGSYGPLEFYNSHSFLMGISKCIKCFDTGENYKVPPFFLSSYSLALKKVIVMPSCKKKKHFKIGMLAKAGLSI